MAIIFIIGSLALIVILPAILFVSLVWTHRPDLSVLGIMREAGAEIRAAIRERTKQRLG